MAQINKPSDYFNTKLYSGTGSSQAVTGVGFQPDWIWFKCRQANNHNWFDVIRGSDKIIQSSTTNAEATSTALLTSFDSDGFTVNTDDGVNGSGKTYASWNWLANGTGSANTDGTISSTVSANTTSGFSIVSYTGNSTAGATIGHGLGVTPNVIITKARTNSGRFWGMYHSSLGNTGSMALNSTQVFDTSTTYWNDTNPTSSVYTVGTNGDSNSSSGMIAYCFAEKKGYSKFGSYVGNGSNDGTFIYTGFKPSFVICKASSVGGSVGYAWSMFDNKRSSYNIERSQLEANTSDAQQTDASGDIDFLSNGFKFRSTASENNQSGATYIYLAFAENPLVGTNNIPATAR